MGDFGIEWQTIKRSFLAYFYELVHFNFSVTNPVFWLFFLILLFVLLKSWKIKKAFSFCFVIALILLSVTKIENYIMKLFRKSGESFDPLVTRISCIIFILVVALYYFFIAGNDD
ncbi:MAG: hypothetical protein M0R48_07050 [Candidatus Omnitrophica bacterium]|jgi:hypothetical protein|nr:hypothetical protein [Candidatus Omnitrophota bacterium]